jgi:tagaturonate reductase
MYQEIIPTVALPEKELADYAEGIKERFENPYVKHQLSSIALNSISKFTARLLPTLKRYVAKNQELPKRIVLALAAYLKIYRGQADFEPSDTAEVLAAFKKIAGDENYVHEALSNSDFWGEDLTKISGLEALVNKYLTEIDQKGTRAIVERINAE